MNGTAIAVGEKASFDPLTQVGAICAREDSSQGQLPIEIIIGPRDIVPDALGRTVQTILYLISILSAIFSMRAATSSNVADMALSICARRESWW